MKPLITLFIILFAGSCFAQNQNVYFLKNDGRYVQDRDSADYIRVVNPPDSGSVYYNVSEFFPNGKNKLQGKTSVIYPLMLEGPCTGYYKNGNKQYVINYIHGKLIGDYIEYYPNGKPYMIRKYPYIVNAAYNDTGYLITAEYDSLGTTLVTNGNGSYKEFDDDFKNIINEGHLKDGKKDGEWKGIEQHMGIRFIEIYDNGNLVSGLSISGPGDTLKYGKVNYTAPQFKGGGNAFAKYLSSNIKYPGYEKEHNIQGKVLLTFVVEKDGAVTNVKVIKSVSNNIDNEAYRVISQSDNWTPGTMYGRPVRMYFTIPLSFTLKSRWY